MTELDKIDRVLKFIINCEQPPKRNATEITKELDFNLSTKETIEILDKLTKDNYVIREIQDDDIAYYFSSFEGRLFLKEGGYSSRYTNQRRKSISIATMTVTNAVIIIILTFLNYRATDKANHNKEEVAKLNSTIQHLTKSKDSLINIIYKDTTRKH